MGITYWISATCATSHSQQPSTTSNMSRIVFLLVALAVVATVMSVVRAEDVEVAEVDGEGRTFGHLAKPLKKFTNKLGHYLVHATSDYYPNQYYAAPIHHYGGYYGGYGQNGLGSFHRPSYLGGFAF